MAKIICVVISILILVVVANVCHTKETDLTENNQAVWDARKKQLIDLGYSREDIELAYEGFVKQLPDHVFGNGCPKL